MKSSDFNSIWKRVQLKKTLLLTVELEMEMEKAVEVSNCITSRDIVNPIVETFFCFVSILDLMLCQFHLQIL